MIENPLKTYNKAKKVFKKLRCYFKISWGNWYPILWISPKFFQIESRDVQWKDKYDTPRYEGCPYFWIHIGKLNIIWYWELPELYNDYDNDEYWEQLLWYLYYYNTISYGRLKEPNIEKAKESYPWQNSDGTPAWSDKYLLKI